jgi:hypothetical protein
MKVMLFRLVTITVLLVLVAPAAGAVLADEPGKDDLVGAAPGAAGTVVLSNGIYELTVTDTDSGIAGLYTVGTGPSHPYPGANVLFGGASYSPGTSYLSVLDYSDDIVFTPSPIPPEPEPTGLGIAYLGANGVDFDASGRRSTTTWDTGTGLEVVQVAAVEGSTVRNSCVRVTTRVRNIDDSMHSVGIRYEWDLEIASADNAWFARRDPDSSYTQDEQVFTPPHFDRFETTDNPGHPSFSVFGSIEGPVGRFSPDPTPPERFIFAQWDSAFGDPWDYPEGQDPSYDSAVLYYWGWDGGNSPIDLSPGESTTVTAYIYALAPGIEEEEAVEEEHKPKAPEPASMATSYLSVDPAQVLPGQEVRVSANVCNQGGEKGSLTVALVVNGAAEQSQSVSVSGGSCKEVRFSTARAVPGTYMLTVNGMQGQFTVLAPRLVQASVPSAQDTGLGTWGIVAIIVVAVALILGLVVVFR